MKNDDYITWLTNEKIVFAKQDPEHLNLMTEISNHILDLYGFCHSCGIDFEHARELMTNLIYEYPLTPIDRDDTYFELKDDGQNVKTYINKRWPSLIKKVLKDGDTEKIRYFDSSRSIVIDIDDLSKKYNGGIGEAIFNEMCPIEFPYEPPKEPIRIFIQQFKCRKESQDVDTIGVLYFRKPSGKMTEVKRFFKIDQSAGFVEITMQEYFTRKKKSEEIKNG